MDPEEDVLFLFLTSHGTKDGRLSIALYPSAGSRTSPPPELRKMLDDAGIRNRVIVVSSCYSGTFVDALRDDDTLVMTASAKNRNSFGCSNEADFTYFGKAYFDEALRVDAIRSSRRSTMRLPTIAAREKARRSTRPPTPSASWAPASRRSSRRGGAPTRPRPGARVHAEPGNRRKTPVRG